MKFNDEQLRVIENLAVAYDGWLGAQRTLGAYPHRLTWKTVSDKNYLYAIRDGRGNGQSLGPRSPETEAIFDKWHAATTISDAAWQKLREIGALYRALKLPTVSTMAGRLLRELDARELLGSTVLVVGTNTMAAYELHAMNRFATGMDATEDFDMTWAGDRNVALNLTRTPGGALLDALKAVDSTFVVNVEKPFQARNAEQYEVELLLAPSRQAHYPTAAALRPVALPEQEWLLNGTPLTEVVCDRGGLPCRLAVPDPRWMALHKLWLSDKPERNARKREKDSRQGNALLQIIPYAMPLYPLDANFRAAVPSVLQAYLPPLS